MLPSSLANTKESQRTGITQLSFSIRLSGPRVSSGNNFGIAPRTPRNNLGRCEFSANGELTTQRGLTWQETNTIRQPNTTKMLPRHIVPPLNIMARATMPRAKNTPPVQSNIHRPPTSIVIRPTQRASSRNSDKRAWFTAGPFFIQRVRSALRACRLKCATICFKFGLKPFGTLVRPDH